MKISSQTLRTLVFGFHVQHVSLIAGIMVLTNKWNFKQEVQSNVFSKLTFSSLTKLIPSTFYLI